MSFNFAHFSDDESDTKSVYIKHIRTGYYLYSPSKFHMHDASTRNVYTWRTEDERVTGDEGKWIIKKESVGTYSIKNKYYLQ